MYAANRVRVEVCFAHASTEGSNFRGHQHAHSFLLSRVVKRKKIKKKEEDDEEGEVVFILLLSYSYHFLIIQRAPPPPFLIIVAPLHMLLTQGLLRKISLLIDRYYEDSMAGSMHGIEDCSTAQ